MTPGARSTPLWAVIRLGVAALGVAAVVAQFVRTISIALDATTPYGSHVPTVVGNFFSFFTIQSNLGAAAALATIAIWTLRRGRDGQPAPRSLAVFLACTATYMLVTGVVYNTLLRGVPIPQGQTVGWSNEVLHVVVPLFLLLDVLIAPAPRRLPWSTIALVVAYPVVWAGYTLVRANLTVNPGNGNPWWYPYPFLDPHLQGGYGGVAVYVVGIAAAIGLCGALVVGVTRLRSRRHVDGRDEGDQHDPRPDAAPRVGSEG